MSEARLYNDGKPIDNDENTESGYNRQNNPVQLNSMISQQEVSSPEILRGDINDDYDELDETVDNRNPVISHLMSEETEELDETVDNRSPEMTPSLSGEAIRNDPNETSMEHEGSFFDHEESEKFNQQWMEIQGKFVDEPRIAVQKADDLISDMIKKITSMFDEEHNTLETQWKQGDEVSTEDLRMTFQHYRSFFHRLLD